MKVWRICRKRHLETAFSGAGARLAGGRWNSIGVSIGYSAEYLSLAALELFVHVSREEEPDDLIAVQAELPLDFADMQKQKSEVMPTLPQSWRYDHDATRAIGDAWCSSGASLTMLVPSVVIQVEWNVLINPAHQDFAKIKVSQSFDFRFDERMFKDLDGSNERANF